jgi:pilus assembly protein Flp/PilA
MLSKLFAQNSGIWLINAGLMRGETELWGKATILMNTIELLRLLHRDEQGQGLVEYLLILALVAFAATAGMGSLASGLNSAFTEIGVILGNYIS